ncbi:MAG: Sucrose-6-phosphate hydrolase [Planctomycetota bacterium]|jgi:sucrose-6-phosphate hydrolase SacC (GH32 family)
MTDQLTGILAKAFHRGLFASIAILACICASDFASGDEPLNGPLRDKTLVAWASPANLTQQGGSILTINDNDDRFDGIIFGEIQQARWMAGSDLFRRTIREQKDFPAETLQGGSLVQIAICYQGKEITVYRDGNIYSRHTIENPQEFHAESLILIGPRHRSVKEYFEGEVADARIYDSALTEQQIRALRIKEPGDIKPWAWWTFDDPQATERTGRIAHTQLQGGAFVRAGKLVLNGSTAALVASKSLSQITSEPSELSFHLMHPGGPSLPGDPNAAFCLDGKFHLHYILQHPWGGNNQNSFSFIHVTSPDMLHWEWQPTKLQPSFTGHGMFSGTGFMTKDGKPAVIYHGQASGRNQIAIAKDRNLNEWFKPYAVEVKNSDGTEAKINHWDPDCFLIGDTYYAISGGENPPLMKSKDLKNWELVGDFISDQPADVAIGEDVSCPNFFKLGDKWMLLCISHPMGCRYYLGDWDAKQEKFIPTSHGRMNARREDQPTWGLFQRTDFFAPESVLTDDGRRVMWAWLTSVGTNNKLLDKTIQSLPRELSLPADGVLRIKPLTELQTLRHDPIKHANLVLDQPILGHTSRVPPIANPFLQSLVETPSEACEIRLEIPREDVERKLFGFMLFSDGKGGGLPLMFRPETSTVRLGNAETAFPINQLGKDENLEIRIFIDKYLVEVFIGERTTLVGSYLGNPLSKRIDGFTVGSATRITSLETWKLKSTNEGFHQAQQNPQWRPNSK